MNADLSGQAVEAGRHAPGAPLQRPDGEWDAGQVHTILHTHTCTEVINPPLRLLPTPGEYFWLYIYNGLDIIRRKLVCFCTHSLVDAAIFSVTFGRRFV